MSGIAGGAGAAEVLARIDGALKNAGAMSEGMTRHHLWVVRGVMADINPERDLSAAELLALLAILAPVHSTVLDRRAGLAVADRIGEAEGFNLRLVGDATSNLS